MENIYVPPKAHSRVRSEPPGQYVQGNLKTRNRAKGSVELLSDSERAERSTVPIGQTYHDTVQQGRLRAPSDWAKTSFFGLQLCDAFSMDERDSTDDLAHSSRLAIKIVWTSFIVRGPQGPILSNRS